MTGRQRRPGAAPASSPRVDTGKSRAAAAALAVALAHVRRHHLAPPASAPPAMVVLNLLRELDTLLRHAIAEAAGPAGGVPGDRRAGWRLLARAGPGHAPTPVELRGFAAVDGVRLGLHAIDFPASGRRRAPRSGRTEPSPAELLGALAAAVRLTEAIARRLHRPAAGVGIARVRAPSARRAAIG